MRALLGSAHAPTRRTAHARSGAAAHVPLPPYSPASITSTLSRSSGSTMSQKS
jgi:hypothetical protein